MKRILWNITLSSIITLVAYIALFAFWGAFLMEIEDQTLRFFVINLLTTIVYVLVLLLCEKKRGDVGDEEILADYRDTPYLSCKEDFRLILRREWKVLVAIVATIALCFALNLFDELVMEKKTVSNIAFLYIPLFIFTSSFKIAGLGYILSAVLICILYPLFLLLYRRKKYIKWFTAQK